MSETKHMQGPWETHHGYDVTGYPCYYLHGVCGDGKRDTAVHEANARLIAAAPDLLAALKDMRETCAALMRAVEASASPQREAITHAWVAEMQRLKIDDGVGVRANQAIAKAEGRDA